MTREVFLNKRFIITGILAMFTLFFLGLFSESPKDNPIFQTFLVSIAFFLVVPLLYCKIVLREPLKNIGWQSGNAFAGMLVSMLAIAVGLVIVFVLYRYTAFQTEYRLPIATRTNFWWFVLYEALLVPFIALLYEVFFRGFIQRLWLQSLGIWAVVVQGVFFVGLLSLSDGLSWERVPAVLFAFFSGLIVYYSGSLWYAWGASWLFFFLVDIFYLIAR